MIRIVGLSATLPNYKDVASFLGVTDSGMFYFDASYRPVPLAMQFIGATDKHIMASKNVMDQVCFQKVLFVLLLLCMYMHEHGVIGR
jgi:replicative superfamily II helicase